MKLTAQVFDNARDNDTDHEDAIWSALSDIDRLLGTDFAEVFSELTSDPSERPIHFR